MEQDRLRFLVNRYLNNRCTLAELDELLTYIRKHPEDKDLLNQLKTSWDPPQCIDDSVESEWTDMQKRMRKVSSEENRVFNHKLLWRVAASLVAVAVFLAGFFLLKNNAGHEIPDQQTADIHSIVTGKGEHRMIVLSDGSRIWINSNSRVTVPPVFAEEVRSVVLHGEAFFDIQHDPQRPFIITTGTVKTTVLGTSFNIRAFPEEKDITVTVKRGKVKVEAKNKEAHIIGANEQIRFNLPKEELYAAKVDAMSVSKWTEEDLIFHDITMDEVEEILEERYAVEIQFDNQRLKQCRFTSTFFKNATIDEVLTSICMVNEASYDNDGGIITIYGKGCP